MDVYTITHRNTYCVCTGCVNGQESLDYLTKLLVLTLPPKHRYPLPEFSTTGTVVKETSVEVQVNRWGTCNITPNKGQTCWCHG